MKRRRPPLSMGVWGIMVILFLWPMGILTLLGYLTHNTKSELLAIGDYHTSLPRLQTAKILTSGNDFELAEKVLGWNSEADEMLHPEKIILSKIEELEKRLTQSPASTLYTQVAIYYWQIKETEKAKEAIQLALKIDPNNEEIIQIVSQLK